MKYLKICTDRSSLNKDFLLHIDHIIKHMHIRTQNSRDKNCSFRISKWKIKTDKFSHTFYSLVSLKPKI